MGKPEGNIEKYLKTTAQKHGFDYYKFTSPGCEGVPDRIIVGHGLTVFVELKAPGKYIKKGSIQEDTILEIKNKGGIIFVINSKEQCDKLISSLLYASAHYHKELSNINQCCYNLFEQETQK